MQEQAATLESLRELPGVVGGQEHQRDLLGLDGAELGDRHLVVGEDLQQEGLRLHLDAIHLVDEQHDGLIGGDGLQEGTGEEELVGEDVILHRLPRLVVAPLGLDAQQLLLVVPLEQRLGLIEPLVALEPDQPGARHLGHGLGQLRLAGAGRALHEDGLAEAIGQVDDPGDALVG